MPLNFLLDLDGTLIDSAPDVLGMFEKVLAGVPVPSGVRIDRSHIGRPVREILHMLLPEATPAQVERLNGEFRRMYDNCGFPSSVLYEGVRETLDILSSRGDELFLVTNKPVKPTQELLRKFGLKVFRDLICPDMHGPRNIAKDEMIKIILERHGLNRRRTIMVGDAELDIHAARTAGVRVAAALYGYGDSEKIITLKPDFLLKEFSGLLTLCAGPE